MTAHPIQRSGGPEAEGARPRPRTVSVALTVLAVVWAALVRLTCEHWWWVDSAAMSVPAFAGPVWLAWRAGQAGSFPVSARGGGTHRLLSLKTLDASAGPALITALAQRKAADIAVL